MENRYQRFLLRTAGLLLLATAPPALSQQSVIEPDIDRREIRSVDIDSENFEVGAFVGILSIQDFASDAVYGVRGAWHITEDFFFEANYGQSQGDLTSFEKLSGGAPLFDDDERDYRYYSLNLGWNALPGEIYIRDDYAMKSDLYFIAGAGSTDFLGDNWFTFSVGAGFRLLINDWLAWRIDVRDHIFDRDAFGAEETTHNLELTTGITVFF